MKWLKRLILEEEAQAEEAKEAQAVKEAASSDKPLIVAVTACMTGIAHTYMAEESLIKTGEKNGCQCSCWN